MTREIKIIPVLNGFIVQAGCQTVVFNSAKRLVTELEAYYADPAGVEARYLKEAINKKTSEGPQVPPPAGPQSNVGSAIRPMMEAVQAAPYPQGQAETQARRP